MKLKYWSILLAFLLLPGLAPATPLADKVVEHRLANGSAPAAGRASRHADRGGLHHHRRRLGP